METNNNYKKYSRLPQLAKWVGVALVGTILILWSGSADDFLFAPVIVFSMLFPLFGILMIGWLVLIILPRPKKKNVNNEVLDSKSRQVSLTIVRTAFKTITLIALIVLATYFIVNFFDS